MVSLELTVSRRELLSASAILGFSIGIALWLTLQAAVFIIERPHSYYGGTLSFIVMALLSGVVWSAICAVSFPLMWKLFHVSGAVWPSLGRAALMAFLVQAVTLFIFDFL